MTFTAFSEGVENRWGGITFYNKSWDQDTVSNYIKNSYFENGVFNQLTGASPYFRGVTFTGFDDAILCESGSHPTVLNSTFSGNNDAIESGSDRIIVKKSKFVDNNRAINTNSNESIIGGSAEDANIFENNNIALQNSNGSTTVPAEYNYWGSVSGPSHPDNEGGQGDLIMGNADYIPFISMNAPDLQVEPGFFGNILTWSSEIQSEIEGFQIDRCCNNTTLNFSNQQNEYIEYLSHRNASSNYIIRAFTSEGNFSLDSDPVVVSNQLFNIDIDIVGVSNEKITIQFPDHQNSNIVSYDLYRGNDTTNFENIIASFNFGETDEDGSYFYEDIGHQENTYFTYALRAKDSQGNYSSFSPFVESTTLLNAHQV